MRTRGVATSARAIDENAVQRRRRLPGSRKRVFVATLFVLGIVLLGGIIAAVAAVVYLRASDRATPVEVGAVVARFNHNVITSPKGEGRGPIAGVYVYDTTGEEHVDALGGATHSYPDATTITVTRTPCGFDSRWDALKERWHEMRICTSALADELRSVSAHHEFFGRIDQREFECAKDSFARPPSESPGFTWSTHCLSSDAQFTGRGQVVGTQRFQIGTQPVDTLHFRMTTRTSGSSRGSATHEVWIVPESGLVVQRIGRVDSEADGPIGSVHYREDYTIRLRSLAPLAD